MVSCLFARKGVREGCERGCEGRGAKSEERCARERLRESRLNVLLASV